MRRGEKIERETRHCAKGGYTERLRTKETEEEYGYIFDPDLPVFKISKEQIAKVERTMPELPQQKLARLQKQYKLPETLVEQLVVDKELADCFEAVAKKIDSKLVATWFTGYLRKTLTFQKLAFRDTGLTPDQMLEFLDMVQKQELTDRGGELLLRELVLKPQSPRKLAEKLGLLRMSEEDLVKAVKEVLKEHKKAVKDRAIHFLIGDVVRKTKGSADAKLVRKLIERLL